MLSRLQCLPLAHSLLFANGMRIYDAWEQCLHPLHLPVIHLVRFGEFDLVPDRCTQCIHVS